MFTIKDAAGIFGQIDAIADGDMPALDKGLRNLSQRLYLPPADRQGAQSARTRGHCTGDGGNRPAAARRACLT